MLVAVGQTGADVEELTDPRLAGQVPYGPASGTRGQRGADGRCPGTSGDLVADPAVDREMVLPAQPVVPDPCRMRDGRVCLVHLTVLLDQPWIVMTISVVLHGCSHDSLLTFRPADQQRHEIRGRAAKLAGLGCHWPRGHRPRRRASVSARTASRNRSRGTHTRLPPAPVMCTIQSRNRPQRSGRPRSGSRLDGIPDSASTRCTRDASSGVRKFPSRRRADPTGSVAGAVGSPAGRASPPGGPAGGPAGGPEPCSTPAHLPRRHALRPACIMPNRPGSCSGAHSAWVWTPASLQ